jgi:hypothetical protein
VVEAIAADRIDLAWLGGFICATRLKPVRIPLVQRAEDTFTSKIISADPSVNSLQDLTRQNLRVRPVLYIGRPNALFHAARWHQARRILQPHRLFRRPRRDRCLGASG